jgi:flagellar motor protein MotB
MMAFFMVMWLISQNEKVKEAVAHHFRNETGKYAMGESLYKPKHEQLFKDHRPVLQHGDSPTPPIRTKSRHRSPISYRCTMAIARWWERPSYLRQRPRN